MQEKVAKEARMRDYAQTDSILIYRAPQWVDTGSSYNPRNDIPYVLALILIA